MSSFTKAMTDDRSDRIGSGLLCVPFRRVYFSGLVYMGIRCFSRPDYRYDDI